MSDYISREEALDICQKEYEERLRMLDYCGDTVAWNIGGEIKALPAADVVPVPKTGIGDASDGFHTFNELYHHRAILFSVICNLMREKAWKSKRHDTGDMYDGMFIVGIETPDGQATYHYDINPYWDMFDVKEVEYAPKWDGHTPDDAIKRIGSLSAADVAPVRRGHVVWVERPAVFAQYERHHSEDGITMYVRTCAEVKDKVPYCSECEKRLDDRFMKFCSNCGADIKEEA